MPLKWSTVQYSATRKKLDFYFKGQLILFEPCRQGVKLEVRNYVSLGSNEVTTKKPSVRPKSPWFSYACLRLESFLSSPALTVL